MAVACGNIYVIARHVVLPVNCCVVTKAVCPAETCNTDYFKCTGLAFVTQNPVREVYCSKSVHVQALDRKSVV